MTHVARLVTAVLGALCLAPIGAETARAQVPRDRALSASLVRCREQSTVTCVELDGGLTTALSSGRGSPSQSGEAAPSLELALGSPSFLGPLLYGKREVSEPTYLLVLLDVSGSMTGNGIAHTRAALKQFVQSLPNIGIRVTVVPFGSRRVEETIRSARFGRIGDAVTQLDAIPAPDNRANTALYTAVRTAAQVVAGESFTGGYVRRAILLVTDGKNEVFPGDDRGLLPRDSLVAAANALQRNEVELFALGVGDNIGRAQLDSLAGSKGHLYISPLDPLALTSALTNIGASIANRSRLVYTTSADVSVLARITRSNWLIGRVGGGGRLDSVRVLWSPPLLALPVFESKVGRGDVDGSFAEQIQGLEAPPLERMIYALIVVFLTVLFWTVVPRWIWPPTVVDLNVARERGSEVAAAGDSGVRRDVREAPPRRPTADTGEYPVLG